MPSQGSSARTTVDELFAGLGEPREHASSLVDGLDRMGRFMLMELGKRRDVAFTQQGITFEIAGNDGGPGRDRPFPLDLVPRIIPAAEWEMVLGCPQFRRAVHGVRPPGGIYCHVSGCDLVRDGDGIWKVLEDNVRTPSGISYVLENRLAMTRLVPELFNEYSVRPVADYPALLLEALREVSPSSDQPRIVVWTPGPANSAYFEHAFLARQMGVDLVEAGDLTVRDNTCFVRTTEGLVRVDAIYRRLDDDFVDPLEFRPDSLLGVPGLMRAYRAGTVALANAVGTGVADDKAVYSFVPTMIEYYLGESPVLDNVPTYLLRDPEQRDEALARLDEL